MIFNNTKSHSFAGSLRIVTIKATNKIYIWAYRNEGAFHEAVTDQILDDLVRVCIPRFMRISAEFNVRGGIYTTVVTEHCAPEWVAPVAVQLPYTRPRVHRNLTKY